ncbi:hypothetical protein [Agromyces soli]|uniref:Uncharacterized protein n=1 Tax=Agromyces soli TaxID=659012 RepID=A0ABY4ARC9_9MICO|nr:hypothetical protein [Agromyces soli]UOE25693.1 hypothetical protein MTP13_15415 [Agromyces soli]
MRYSLSSRIAASRAGAIAAIAAALAVAGCASAPDLAPSELVGAPLDRLTGAVGDEVQLLIQDASPRLGLAASYAFDHGGDSAWTIMAICSSGSNVLEPGSVEVAVVPSESVTAEVEAELRAGDWSDATDCDGRPHRG